MSLLCTPHSLTCVSFNQSLSLRKVSQSDNSGRIVYKPVGRAPVGERRSYCGADRRRADFSSHRISRTHVVLRWDSDTSRHMAGRVDWRLALCRPYCRDSDIVRACAPLRPLCLPVLANLKSQVSSLEHSQILAAGFTGCLFYGCHFLDLAPLLSP